MLDQIDILTLDRHWNDGMRLSTHFHFNHKDISSRYRELDRKEAKLRSAYLDLHGRLFRNNRITDVFMYDTRSTVSNMTESWGSLKSELSEVSTRISEALINDLRSGEYIAFAKNKEHTGPAIDVTADLLDSFGTFSTQFDFDQSAISEEKAMGRTIFDVVVFDRMQFTELKSKMEAGFSMIQPNNEGRPSVSGGRPATYDWNSALDEFLIEHMIEAEFENASRLVDEIQKAFTISGQGEPEESYVRKMLAERFPKF